MNCDSILMHTVTRLSIMDRIRVLFGSPIQTTTWGIEALVDKPEVMDALAVVESQTFVARLFYIRSRGGYVEAAATPPGERFATAREALDAMPDAARESHATKGEGEQRNVSD